MPLVEPVRAPAARRARRIGRRHREADRRCRSCRPPPSATGWPMILRARQFTFNFPGPVLLMGIVNVTPDSFSDGGKFFGADAAVQHALELIRDGADMIDV